MVTKSKKPKKILLFTSILLLLFTSIVWGVQYPSPTRDFYVNDFANVLSPSAEAYILSTAVELERTTSAQVVVVTMEDLENEALEEYSLGLLREWGIGAKEANNGVLILLDIGGGQSRIEVGYGLEGALPDGKTGRIQDNYMIPYYQQGDYSKGIVEGFNAIANEVYKEYGYEDQIAGDYRDLQDNYRDTTPKKEGVPPIVLIIGLILIVPLIILDFKLTGGAFTYMLIRMLGRGGGNSGGPGNSGGGGSGGGGGSSRRF
ncbi:TPM domain-containing protein [Alkaliphilus hydrothermalis]|uniref:TPM domain-containing protein n=1 Tax=Alkaliphilus hydrothermalis TaxID=1482730 RepID=A0ABS2NRS6_9FIRM|nr:TPM domain-containing protein [Alkaliphilus hydrothermalis]MBM7615631.1 uncharacterized protein [Alkaliphilus hydrothermalis]